MGITAFIIGAEMPWSEAILAFWAQVLSDSCASVSAYISQRLSDSRLFSEISYTPSALLDPQ